MIGLARYGAYGVPAEWADYELLARDEREAAEAYLAETATALTGRGRMVTTTVSDGAANQVIVGSAKPGDTIVMASHGRSGIARWFLGSVADHILRHALVPVLLVRAVAIIAEQAAAAASLTS